ncbi:U-box domain-containing protein 44-like [Vitis riparia]|uniref:U-box domain-containing protein 44-like n=1 Tax=Vitis riparia TaxID=96939 RepID=UPI00155ADF99|nr:U-box domain-containing protein 44-like [Vitis riparia]XP_034704818.1 U-box domain-containing protein 44-like [Vitis riparia]
MGSRTKTFSELLAERQASAGEVASLSKDSETEQEILAEFASLVAKFGPILDDLRENKVMDTPLIREAVESLEKELGRARGLMKSLNPKISAKQIEELTRGLGRSLGLVLSASLDFLSVDVKEKIGALHKEMMKAKFDTSSIPDREESEFDREKEFVNEFGVEDEIVEEMNAKFDTSSSPDREESEYDRETESVNEFGVEDEIVEEVAEVEIEEIEEEIINLDIDDVVLQLKYGNDEEFKFALSGLRSLIRDQMVDDEWINDEGVVLILSNRLGSSKPNNRLTIIQMLRNLVENAKNKEKLADPNSLSTIVKSLTRDVEERREAVGLLLDLSDLPAVHRRLGRIQGCIVMLVAILNGEDPVASRDAGKLLSALSSNTQNALHMAEAGYFKPLVHYLKEGSDMSKILMATALSRMELTDQSRGSLGKDGAIEPLVKMFNAGKLESKLSALSALQNLSMLTENIQRLISSGIVVALLQLLFSVTSVLMTLREPASAILARIAQSESILVNQDVAQQMLSLLNLSSPVIQYHLLQALNSIAAHSSASKVRNKMKENGAIQLLLPFLSETNTKTRTGALNLLYTLSKYLPAEFTEQLSETHLNIIVNIISLSTSDSEKAAAVGILSNLPVNDKKATDTLKRANLLPILVSIMSSFPATSTPTTCWLVESIAGVFIRFTVPSDKKLQLFSAEHGVIPLLVKLLSSGSPVAKCRAATSLAQLSQNSLSLRKSRSSRWFCVPPSVDAYCEIHDGFCFVKSTFCLLKADAISPLVQILEGDEREADEAALNALATLAQDEIWEHGINRITKISGAQPIIKVLELGTVKAQEKALWILERIFRVEAHRVQYGESAQVVLIDLAQKGDPKLKSTIAKLLAQLELLQAQSSYF